MTGPERGFALLCSHLGDPERKSLTTAQFRKLRHRMRSMPQPTSSRDLERSDLTALGYSPEEADRILSLLAEEDRLELYLRRAKRSGCDLIVCSDPRYPRRLGHALGDDAPALLWCRGDLTLLSRPCISLVGSRELRPSNEFFARRAGIEAARQGFVLVSGNARGADRTGQDACLAIGGSVISVLADSLEHHTPQSGTLLLCEDSFDLGFSALRALSRNRLIHALSDHTLVAQSSLKSGGTWDGSVKNLRFGWSSLCVFDDNSESSRLLSAMGAALIQSAQLQALSSLPRRDATLI